MGAAGKASARRGALGKVALTYAVALVAAALVARALPGLGPLAAAAAADVAATLVVFAASVLCDNSSLYDPYWSVAPVFIALYWAPAGARAGAPLLRAALAVGLLAAWGVRLTANWLLRWRGLEDEDFRYLELRRRTGRAYWPVSLLTVHLMPTAWVFGGLWPLYGALTLPGRPLGALDAAALVVSAGAILLEAAADTALRRFRRLPGAPGAVLDRGLWALCRHPNYLGEVLFWWGLYLLGLAARPDRAYTALGPAAITLLFVTVSVPWMDRRMLARHPGYAERMRTTPALFPWRRRRSGAEAPGAPGRP